jgi:hypothetical protein
MRHHFAGLCAVVLLCVGYATCETPPRFVPQTDPISVADTVPLTPPAEPKAAPPLVVSQSTPPAPSVYAIEGLNEIEPGRMLTLTVSGVTTTAAIDGPLPGVSWAMYPQSSDVRIERNGHAIHATWPGACHVWFVASVNNPDPTGKPLTAMKLVKVGEPKPVPKPEPPQPKPEPTDDSATAERLFFVAVDNFSDRKPNQAAILDATADHWRAIESHGHSYLSLDADSEKGRVYAILLSMLPGLIVMDADDGRVLGKLSLPTTPQEVTALEAKYAKVVK